MKNTTYARVYEMENISASGINVKNKFKKSFKLKKKTLKLKKKY